MKIRNRLISCLIISCLVLSSFNFQLIYATNGQRTNSTSEEVEITEDITGMASSIDDAANPEINRAEINGNILNLNFNKGLDLEIIPFIEDFTVSITQVVKDEKAEGNIILPDIDLEKGIYAVEHDTIDDTIYSVTSDTIDITEINLYGKKAVLTLSTPAGIGDSVKISYTPSQNALSDLEGNPVPAFDDYEVTNLTGEVGLPDFVVENIYNELDTSALSDELARRVYYAMLDFHGTKDELREAANNMINMLASGAAYGEMSEANQIQAESFFGISDSFLIDSNGKGENLEEAVLLHGKMASAGLTEEEITASIQNDERDQVLSEKEQALSEQVEEPPAMRVAATADDPFSEIKYDKENALSAPFQHNSAANEQINLNSGTLDYNATDVVLPGAGGLDLVIERQYSTEQASYYGVTGRSQYVDSSSGRTKNSYMQLKKREKYFEKNSDGTVGEHIDSTSYEYMSDELVESDAFQGIYNWKQIVDEGSFFSAYLYRQPMTTDIYGISAYQVSNPITRNDELWQLGTGWKFNFSYMDIDGFYDYKKLHLSDGREFAVSSNWVNNLGHYTYKDVIFKNESVSVRGQNSTYSVTYADGKKEYFDGSGRLIGIVDRFGNTISFTYVTVNNKLEMQITDTLGRVISLTNQTTSTGYNKVLTLPEGKTITYVLTHNTGRTIDEFDSMEDFPGQNNEYNLTKFINQVGEETSYNYSDILCDADFVKRFYMGSDGIMRNPNASGEYYYWNYYAGLSKITYPTGLAVNYEYYPRRNAWYDYGCIDDIAIKKRYDQQGLVIYNAKEYDYYNRFVDEDGVVTNTIYNADDYKNDSWSNWWVSEKDIARNITTKYYFDHSHGSCVGVLTYKGSQLIQEVSTEYRTFNLVQHPSKMKVTTKRYDTSDGQAWTTVECYAYDDRGNPVTYWPVLAEGNTADTEYKVTMAYHPSYNYLTGKTYKRDVATTINEQNLPSGDGKAIAQSLVYENGALKAKSDFHYDTLGNVTKSKEYTNLSTGAYSETDYGYTNGTYLTSITVLNVINADGTNTGSVSRQATYDAYGRILTETDAKGNVTSYTYDNIGRVTNITYPGTVTKSFAYNTPSNQTTTTDERGFVTRYQYDMAGNLAAVYSMNGAVATLMKSNEYDNVYRLTKEQNNLTEGGGITTYIYDHKDRVTQKKGMNSVNQVLYQENYNYFDDKTTKTVVGDASSGAIVSTEYSDKYGRKIKQGRFVGGVEVFNTFTYNYLGEMLQEKSARANAESFTEPFTTKYEYDFAGNVKKQYDVLGNFTTTTYDAAGHKISVTDPKSNTTGGTYSTLYIYDALGRLIKEETPFATSSVSITKYYYDANGNLAQKQVTNNLQGASATFTKVDYSYDNRDRLVQVKSYNGASVANQVDYEYDAAGNMTAMITGGGTQRTTYGYDRYGNMTALTDPLGMTETYIFDINGNMTTKTDKNGQVTNYTYDGLARKLSQKVTVSGIAQTETFGHTATGALAFAQNYNIRTDYSYDELGRLIKELESNGVEKTYTYDVNGNLKTSVVKVSGVVKKTMSFVYDKKDRLSQVMENGTLVATYTYDANGNRSTLTYGNGNSVDYAYNLANLVTSLQNKKGTGVLSSYAYTYYLDGNQATKTDQTGRLTSYTYDGLGRLTQEAESGGAGAITKALSFDAAGNRAGMTVSGAESYTVGYAYDLNNRLKTETKETGTVTDVTDYYYDNNGNTTAKRTGTLTASIGGETPALSINMTGAELYSYDGFDRLTRYQDANGVSSYTYKPDGLRLSKTVNGTVTTHVWEGSQISLELDGSKAVTNRYIRGVGLIKSDNNGWYLFNGHGDVVQLADGTGAVTKEYAYDAFGNEKNINANDSNPFRYTGEYYDKESGSIYLRARYYEPSTSRWLTPDYYWNVDNMIYGDLEDKSQPDIDSILQSSNLYNYCVNNPTNYMDPSGHKTHPRVALKKIKYFENYNGPKISLDGVFDLDVNFGAGAKGKIKVLGVGVDVGGAMYYDLTTLATENPELNLALSSEVSATNKLRVGFYGSSTINAATAQHLKSEGYAGIKYGEHVVGWNDMKDNDLIISFEGEGYILVGGGFNLKVNLSKLKVNVQEYNKAKYKK